MENSKGTRRPSNFSWQNLLWKVALFLLLLLLVSQLVVIWLMGEQETADAFYSGRRLVVTLETSAIEGKIISSEAKPEDKKDESKSDDNKKDEKKNADGKSDELDKNENKTTPQDTEKKDDSLGKNADEKKADEKKGEPVEEGVAVPLINEEPEEALSALAPSPNPPAEFSNKLIEKTEFGSLPKITSDGTKPWKYYSKQIKDKSKKPIISIILTGLGTNKKIGELALRLPEAINLSFSPYSADLDSWMKSGRISGHELLLDMPMEPSNYPVSDPGPLGLLASKEQQANDSKIKRLMAHDFGYVGFITPQDDVFLDNNELLKSLLNVLSGRGLMLVIGRQPAKNETKELIEKGNTASVIIDTVIDEELTETAVQAHLTLLEQTAKQRGYAVGVARAYPITIKQLNIWADKLEADGFTLAPVSQVVAKRF